MTHVFVPPADILRLRCLPAALLMVCLTLTSTPTHAASDEFSEYARITMRLRFLQKTWHRDLVEQDPVQTQVMDAQVTGQQTTSVAVRLSAAPGTGMAQLYLHGSGSVQSTTAGFTREARVDSLGSHSFQLTKPVFFDGTRFLTGKCYGQVTASTQPVAVRTVVSGVPLLGALGERIAWSETLRRQPTTNSIVVRQVADDVVPEFDCKVEEELATANRSWADMRRQFSRLLPGRQVAWQADSTSDGLSLKVGFQRAPGTWSASRPLLHTTLRPDPEPREDLVVTLSDGMVNELLQTLPLKGVTVSDSLLEELQTTDFRQLFRDGTLQLPPELRSAAAAPARLFSLQFADETPLEVLFDHGSIAIILRFRVIPEVGEASDLHRLTLQVTGAGAAAGQWSLQISDADVAVEDSEAPESSLTDIIRRQARAMLVDQPPSMMPRLARLQEETGLPDLQLRGIRSRDGVLRASFELSPAGENL